MRWKELTPGTTVPTGKRTVAPVDVAAFADLTGDRNPLHDPAAGGGTFGVPVAHGMLVAALAVGLVAEAGVTRGCLLALLDASFAFKGPVCFGDTIAARVTVSERRETKTEGKGLVTLAVEVTNQRGEVVQEGRLVELVATA